MRTIYFLVLVIACLFLHACSDSAVSEMYSPSLTNQLLSVSPKELTFSEFGESKTLTVSALNNSWKFVDYPDWLTITPNSGDASSTVTVTASQNQSADVTRTCVFYLQSTNTAWEYKAYVSASQKNAEPYITLSPSSLSFDASSSTKSVNISSNVKWEATCNEIWLTALQTNDGIEVKVEENTTGVAKNGIIQIFGEGVSKSLSVFQQANGVACSVDNLEFPQDGGTQNFTITTQTRWKAKASNEWIKVLPSTGEAGKNSISVMVDENPTYSDRHGYVFIEVGNVRVAQISVVQKGFYLTIIPASLTFGPQKESKPVSISSNVGWTANTSDNWISLSENKGNGDGVITISVEDIASETQRTGTVSVNSTDGLISENINIVQDGVSISADIQQMHFPYEGGNQDLNIEVNADWTISSDDSWLSFLPNAGSSVNKRTVVSVTENIEEDDRSASFLINTSVYSKEINVLQDGKYFNVNSEALNVQATANTITLDVRTSEHWTAETNSPWLTVSPSSGVGDAVVSISVAENNGSDNRQGQVIFKPADGRQIVINVTQKCKTIEVTPEAITLEYDCTPLTVLVNAVGTFTVSTTTPWIKISNVTTSSFDISAINETYASRSGSVKVAIDGTTIYKELSVTQNEMVEEKAYVDLDLPSGTLWARVNLGAKSHTEFGTYFQWGGTRGGDEDVPGMDVHYSIKGTYMDAATRIWGDEWVMPDCDQVKELFHYCQKEFVVEKGVNLTKFSRNNKVLYLPTYPGWQSQYDEKVYNAGELGYYWTCEPKRDTTGLSAYAFRLRDSNVIPLEKECGSPIRPVRKKK